MHFLPISLLTLLAGALLLAKSRKDQPGKIFAFISWFFIVVGFLIFLCFIAGGICRMTNCTKTFPPDVRQEMMMKGCQHGMDMHCCPTTGMSQSCCQTGMSKGCCGGQCKCQCMCMKHDSMMKCGMKTTPGDTIRKTCPKMK